MSTTSLANLAALGGASHDASTILATLHLANSLPTSLTLGGMLELGLPAELLAIGRGSDSDWTLTKLLDRNLIARFQHEIHDSSLEFWTMTSSGVEVFTNEVCGNVSVMSEVRRRLIAFAKLRGTEVLTGLNWPHRRNVETSPILQWLLSEGLYLLMTSHDENGDEYGDDDDIPHWAFSTLMLSVRLWKAMGVKWIISFARLVAPEVRSESDRKQLEYLSKSIPENIFSTCSRWLVKLLPEWLADVKVFLDELVQARVNSGEPAAQVWNPFNVLATMSTEVLALDDCKVVDALLTSDGQSLVLLQETIFQFTRHRRGVIGNSDTNVHSGRMGIEVYEKNAEGMFEANAMKRCQFGYEFSPIRLYSFGPLVLVQGARKWGFYRPLDGKFSYDVKRTQVDPNSGFHLEYDRTQGVVTVTAGMGDDIIRIVTYDLLRDGDPSRPISAVATLGEVPSSSSSSSSSLEKMPVTDGVTEVHLQINVLWRGANCDLALVGDRHGSTVAIPASVLDRELSRPEYAEYAQWRSLCKGHNVDAALEAAGSVMEWPEACLFAMERGRLSNVLSPELAPHINDIESSTCKTVIGQILIDTRMRSSAPEFLALGARLDGRDASWIRALLGEDEVDEIGPTETLAKAFGMPVSGGRSLFLKLVDAGAVDSPDVALKVYAKHLLKFPLLKQLLDLNLSEHAWSPELLLSLRPGIRRYQSIVEVLCRAGAWISQSLLLDVMSRDERGDSVFVVRALLREGVYVGIPAIEAVLMKRELHELLPSMLEAAAVPLGGPQQQADLVRRLLSKDGGDVRLDALEQLAKRLDQRVLHEEFAQKVVELIQGRATGHARTEWHRLMHLGVSPLVRAPVSPLEAAFAVWRDSSVEALVDWARSERLERSEDFLLILRRPCESWDVGMLNSMLRALLDRGTELRSLYKVDEAIVELVGRGGTISTESHRDDLCWFYENDVYGSQFFGLLWAHQWPREVLTPLFDDAIQKHYWFLVPHFLNRGAVPSGDRSVVNVLLEDFDGKDVTLARLLACGRWQRGAVDDGHPRFREIMITAFAQKLDIALKLLKMKTWSIEELTAIAPESLLSYLERRIQEQTPRGYYDRWAPLVLNATLALCLSRRGFDVKRDARLLDAIHASETGCTMMYLRSTVNVNVRDDKGDTPLELSLRRGPVRVARAILNAGADAEFAGGVSHLYSIVRSRGKRARRRLTQVLDAVFGGDDAA